MTERNIRRFFAPEVIQTSQMDCGPAALASLLQGYGIAASYDRLREACQVELDGTSLEALEVAARAAGLTCEQHVLPLDHLLLPESEALPAIVVTLNPNRTTHFVLVWRRFGEWLEVMDPGTGRRWMRIPAFLRQVYLHQMPVTAETYLEWVGSPEARAGLCARMAALGISREASTRLEGEARGESGWHSIAALDAAVRTVAQLVQSGVVTRGRSVLGLLEQLWRSERAKGEGAGLLPPANWTASALSEAVEGDIRIRGAVLLKAVGPAFVAKGKTPGVPSAFASKASEIGPFQLLWQMIRQVGKPALLAVAAAILLASCMLAVEALVLQGLLRALPELSLSGQRVGAVGVALAVVTLMLCLEWPAIWLSMRVGRFLDVQLRLLLFEKLPRLSDLYFQTRLSSDLADRAHRIHALRSMPDAVWMGSWYLIQFLVTVVALCWIHPEGTALILVAGGIGLGSALLVPQLLSEPDLRARTHSGSLSRFYLEAVRGFVALRSHGGERTLKREQESMLVEWYRAGLTQQHLLAAVEGIQALSGFGLAAALIVQQLQVDPTSGRILLLGYWALQLPAFAQALATMTVQLPGHRNVTLRLLEPLQGPEEGAVSATPSSPSGLTVISAPSARDIRFERAGLMLHAHVLLEDITFHLPAGSHTAIVGLSGAGKSSLLSLLLALRPPTTGSIFVDGALLDEEGWQPLRNNTAWVDPSVPLWNRSLLENVTSGAQPTAEDLEEVLEASELRDVLSRLPQGLQTLLGENGGLLSTGEAQRVRLARALLRRDAGLVVLDEPFRGLARKQRARLLARCRERWAGATLVCVTHDVEETLNFDRVVVLDQGRIVQDGNPLKMEQDRESLYARMLNTERLVRRDLWSAATWRHWQMTDGQLTTSAVERTSAGGNDS